MSRSRPSSVAVAEMFTAHADTAAIQILRESAKALTKADIIEGLAAGGVDRAAAQHAWDRVQRRLSKHPRVSLEKRGRDCCYRWDGQAPTPPNPPEAFDRIVSGKLDPFERQELVEMVRAALAAPGAGRRDVATQSDPIDMEAARALAEMAMEVEELAAKQASAKAMIHRVRARMKRMRLEPIDRAGDEVSFDRQRHQPIGPDIPDGAAVVVVRPGYVWKTPAKDLLIERPVVQD